MISRSVLSVVSNHPASFALVVLVQAPQPTWSAVISSTMVLLFRLSSPIPSHLYYTAPQHSSPSQYHHTVSIERSPAHLKDFTERGCSKSLQKNKIPVGDTASASHRASWTDANAGCGLGPSRLQSKTAMAGVSAACHSCGRVKREARLDRSSRHLPPDAQRLCS
jgi:hypothetical protein